MLINDFRLSGIEVFESGKNVMKGHFAVKCPMCGDDPSAHLNIKYDGTHVICFRCGWKSSDRNNIAKFLQKYFGIKVYVNDELDKDKTIVPRIVLSEEDRRRNLLKFLKTCKRIEEGDRYWKYLVEKRGLEPGFIRFFGFYKISGSDYVWIPVREKQGDKNVVVTMVGRCIDESNDMRYMNLNRESSLKSSKEVLFGLAEADFLFGHLCKDCCVLVEGVFDCLKLLQIGIPAVATLGKEVSQEQLWQIAKIMFETVIYIPDSDVSLDCINVMVDRLSQYCDVVVIDVEKRWRVKDVGDMDRQSLLELRSLVYDIGRNNG